MRKRDRLPISLKGNDTWPSRPSRQFGISPFQFYRDRLAIANRLSVAEATQARKRTRLCATVGWAAGLGTVLECYSVFSSKAPATFATIGVRLPTGSKRAAPPMEPPLANPIGSVVLRHDLHGGSYRQDRIGSPVPDQAIEGILQFVASLDSFQNRVVE